ncbi:hypothetical protein EJB05_34137, partial [Eragrostis curvula]
MPPPPPPELSDLPDDILGDILLCIPQDDPACFLRASLVCKRWRRVLADPAFRRRHRAFHPRPSFLGFLHAVRKDIPYCSRFVPNDPASRRPAARDFPGWLVLDCRHGRALFATPSPSVPVHLDLLVWDPLTGEEHRLPRPSPPSIEGIVRFNAAVLCAAAVEGCDHRGCHGGAFSVVFLCTKYSMRASARVYSSKTGDWSKPTSVQGLDIPMVSSGPVALVGDALYFPGSSNRAFKYQLGTQRLSAINKPPYSVFLGGSIWPMTTKDGGLGFAGVKGGSTGEGPRARARTPRLCLCSTQAGLDGVAQWARVRTIELEMLLPDGALPEKTYVYGGYADHAPNAQVLGFVDGTDGLFVGVRTWTSNPGAVYLVQLDSGRARKVLEDYTFVFPYTSFCIPVTEVASIGEGPREGLSRLDSEGPREGLSRSAKLKLLVKHFFKRRILRAHAATMLPPPELPELPDDVLGDILLRHRPDDPASLLRASLVCKRWRRVLADPAFRRDRGALHRRPSFLGLLHVVSKYIPFCSRFVPNDPTCRRPAARYLPGWLVLDCRHGRALFATAGPSLGTMVTLDFIVWDPLTGEERRLPRLSSSPTPTVGTLGLSWNAAVLCAATAEGCDHRSCHGGPFIVVLLCTPMSFGLSARVYSSETGPSAALVGDTLYFHSWKNRAVKYQLGTQLLSVINEPPASVFQGLSIHPMTMEEGQDGVAQWARLRAIKLEMLLPDVIEVDSTREGPSSMDKLKMLMQRLLNFRIFRVLILILDFWSCRHIGKLFLRNLLVWNPLTGKQHRLPRPSPPPIEGTRFNAAVLCAAAVQGCDHRGCHGGAFSVVFLCTEFSMRVYARVYSSQTGDWSELTSIRGTELPLVSSGPIVLVEDACTLLPW